MYQNIEKPILNTDLRGVEPTLEVYQTTDIPYMKITKTKIQLPFNKRDTQRGNVVFLNTKNIDQSIDLMKHPKIYDNNKYRRYYLEWKYNLKVLNRRTMINDRKSRDPEYRAVTKRCQGIYPVISMDTVRGYNLFYDLHKYNNFYLAREDKYKNYKMKVHAYFDLIMNVINDSQFDQFDRKTMVIDIKSWLPKGVSNTNFTKKQFDNVVFMLYYIMLRDLDYYKSLGDIDIILVGTKGIFKINPSKYKDKDQHKFRKNVNIVAPVEVFSPETDPEKVASEMDMDLAKDAISQQAKQYMQRYGFTGDAADDENEEKLNAELDKTIDDAIGDIVDSMVDSDEELQDPEKQEDIGKELVNDEELIAKVVQLQKEKLTGKSKTSIKRDEELRKRQSELTVRNIKFEQEILPDPEKIKLDVHDVSSKINSTNPNIGKVSFSSFEKKYNEELYPRDIMNVFKSLNDKKIGIYIRDIKVEDSSDEFNFKETWTIQLEDEYRVRHTIKVDMPKFLDNSFLYLGGNKKTINKQIVLNPIVKLEPGLVQLCSNYNKIRIERYGTKITAPIESIKKILETTSNNSHVNIQRGNVSSNNLKYKSIFEYDELSKFLNKITVRGKDTKTYILFNQTEVEELLDKYEKSGILIDSEKALSNEYETIGFIECKEKGKTVFKPITVHFEEQVLEDGSSISEFVANTIGGDFATQFHNKKPAKRHMYARAAIMKKNVPIILLLGYLEGLSTVLRKAEVKYQFVDKKPGQIFRNQTVVKFADGYLVYDSSRFHTSLLLNGLSMMYTENYEYADFDGKDAYLDIIETLYGNKRLGSAFEQFYEWFVDPITLEILTMFNYPTDFTEIILYAIKLLSDNSCQDEADMNINRIRSNEIAVSYLYSGIADAYLRYKNTAHTNNPTKISLPQNYVIKNITTERIVEGYSKLNPIVTLEKLRVASAKGPNGVNLDDAYTQVKRAYHPSMVGIIGLSTSPDASVGKVRKLTLEPEIKNARGILETHEGDLDTLKDVNVFTAAEMLTPMGASCDDPTRTAMASKQSTHIIASKEASPVLITNGAEQVIQYSLNNEFCFVADQDGTVIDIDEKNNFVIVQYKDGTVKAIDVGITIDKNGAGGIFLPNNLICNLTKGQKFKKDDILAYDSKYFKETLFGNKFCLGSLKNIAIMNEFSTFEDSTSITKHLSEDMTTEICMPSTVILGKNSNVGNMVKVGDEVLVGDTLIDFEESFEEESLNQLLSAVGDDLKEEVRGLGKKAIKTKYSGTIAKIEIYSGSELSELSPSLSKIVGNHWKSIKDRRASLGRYDKESDFYKCGVLLTEPDHKYDSLDGKIKGDQVDDGVKIVFHIRIQEPVNVGDKLANLTALKATVGYVQPEGYESYGTSYPDREVSAMIAPGSILNRMTPSILLSMFGNKTLLGLRDKLKEIYES